MTLDEELDEAGKDTAEKLKQKQDAILSSIVSPEFVVQGKRNER